VTLADGMADGIAGMTERARVKTTPSKGARS
jgi:hypothetical protein